MTNKEKFLSLVSPANNETIDAIRFREENKTWLRESKYIAIKFLKALKDKGMTQKELAQLMNVSPQYINKLAKGKENLTLETIVKLQDVLNISLLASASDRMKKSHSVNMFSYQATYQIEYSEYNSSEKKIIGYE